MGSGLVLDASAFIALLNPRDVHHADSIDLAGAPVWDRGLFLHEVSLAECLVGATSADSVDLMIREIERIKIQVLDSRGISGAQRIAALRQQTRCSLPDCYVLDSALEENLTLGTFDQRMLAAAKTLGIGLP